MRKYALLLLMLLAGMATAWAGTKLPFSWKNPKYNGTSFKNILVLAMNGHTTGRLDFEDRMVEKLTRPGVKAEPSYSFLPRPDQTALNMDDVRAVVREQKFDAVLVSRMIKKDTSVHYVPGTAMPMYPYYGSFYGYYGYASPMVYTPGYMQEETRAQIETLVYSTDKPDGELVWAGTTDTVNPKSVTKAINDIVKKLVTGLEKDGVIPAQ